MSNQTFTIRQPTVNVAADVDFTSLSFITGLSENDQVLIYDLSTSSTKKINKSDLNYTPSSLMSSLDSIGIVGGDMVVAASSSSFSTLATQTFGRSLLEASSILTGRSLLGLTIGTDVQEYDSILQALITSGDSAVNNDIFYYSSGALSRVTLSNYARDTILTLTNAAALAANIGALTLSGTAVDNRMVRFDGVSGAIQGTGMTIDDSNNITGVNDITIIGGINGVTAANLSEYANLGSATVNATQWGYVGGADQAITTTDDVTFNSIISTTTLTSAGGSLTSALNMNSNKITSLATPTVGGDATNKTYVDSVAGGSGLAPIEEAKLAGVANVSYTYNNTGGSNSRGSLTAPSNGVGVIDSVTLVVADRIVIKDQTTLLQNGVYVVQDIGSAGTPYILERSADFEPAVDPISKDTFILVTNGTVNAATSWILGAVVTTVGTNDVTWNAFSIQLSAGSGLTLSGGAYNVNTVGTSGNVYINGSDEVDINGSLSILKGGTNTTSFNDTNYLVEYDGSKLATTIETSTVATASNTQTMTNKTLSATTNTITADALWDKTGTKIELNNAPTVLNQVLKLSNLSPLQAQWLTESVDINGTTAETTPDNADEIMIYDDSASVNRKMTRSNFLSGITASLPSGVIRVASANADYTTINAAIAVAVSGNLILVYPGTYAENITIPDGVKIVGTPAAQNIIISGSGTGSRVTITGTSTLREIVVRGPSSGSNAIIDCSGMVAGKFSVLSTVIIQGGGGTNTGHGVDTSGAGVVAFLQVYHNGGGIGGALVYHNGTGGVAGTRLLGNVGSCADFINVAGTGSFQLQLVQVNNSSFYSCTDLLDISGTGDFEIDSIVIPDVSPVINALHITGDGVNISISSAHLHTTSGGFNILVDSGLTGSGSEITLVGCEIIREKTSFPSGYKQGCTVYNVSAVDKGVDNDASYFIDGELSVGTTDNPSELSVGEGDSTVKNMFVFSFNPSGSVWANNTTAAKSNNGSVFSLWAAVASGNIAYIGNLDRKFFNIRTNLTVIISAGGGSYVTEYWNGSAWTSFNTMSTIANSPYTQSGDSLFTNLQEQIRFNTAIDSDWATSTINSQSAYWIRLRIVTAVTTSPSAQRLKLGTNHTEINGDGFIEFFGLEEPPTNLVLGALFNSVGNPGNASFDLSANISDLSIADSRFSATGLKGFSYKFIIPSGTDTSRPLIISVNWIPTSTGTGTVKFNFTLLENIVPGSQINAGSYTEVVVTTTATIASPLDGIMQHTEISIPINSVIENALCVLQIARDGSNDTYGSNIDVFQTTARVIRWHN